MGFRTLEISQSSELHIISGQLRISTKEGEIMIPLEDLSLIFVHGANIRLSTMDLSIFSQYKIGFITLDEKYLPTAIMLPFEGHSRQSKLMHEQVKLSHDKAINLWKQIIERKIENQAKVLSILKQGDCAKVLKFIEGITDERVDYMEAQAAKVYFEYYHGGVNRREDNAINSRLNYGYAVVRSAIARSLVAAGFHPTFGIHHDSQLNPFNLADDLIEPYRAIVDLTAYQCQENSEHLSKEERRQLANVLHSACLIGEDKVNVLSSIDLMVESLKRIILDHSSEELKLPVLIPLEPLEGVRE